MTSARPLLASCMLLMACGPGPVAPPGPRTTAALPSAEPSALLAPPPPAPPPPRRPNPLLCKQLGLACLFVELRTASTEYRATLDAGGHFKRPSIPLSIVLNNDGEGAWSCALEELVLHVEAARSKRVVNKTFPAPEAPAGCRIDKGESKTLVLEAGEFLTEIASGFMKGDLLSIKAEVTIASAEKGMATLAESTTVSVAIFVPEG